MSVLDRVKDDTASVSAGSAVEVGQLWVGIAGNQTLRAGAILRSLELPADLIVTSDDLGVEKPDRAFFVEIAKLAPSPPSEILYVGDRLDNDVRPAAETGFATALIRRGPWGTVQQNDPDASRIPTLRIDTLTELPKRITELNS